VGLAAQGLSDGSGEGRRYPLKCRTAMPPPWKKLTLRKEEVRFAKEPLTHLG